MILIIAVVIIAALIGVLTREKGQSKKEGLKIGALSGLGCILPFLYYVFIFLLFLGICIFIYSWIFG